MVAVPAKSIPAMLTRFRDRLPVVFPIVPLPMAKEPAAKRETLASPLLLLAAPKRMALPLGKVRPKEKSRNAPKFAPLLVAYCKACTVPE